MVPVNEVGVGEWGLDDESAEQGFVDGVLGLVVAHALGMQEVRDWEGLRCVTS